MAISPDAVDHELSMATESEISAVREILVAAGVVASTSRFVYVGLLEPDKALLYGDGTTDRYRRCRAMLLDPTKP